MWRTLSWKKWFFAIVITAMWIAQSNAGGYASAESRKRRKNSKRFHRLVAIPDQAALESFCGTQAAMSAMFAKEPKSLRIEAYFRNNCGTRLIVDLKCVSAWMIGESVKASRHTLQCRTQTRRHSRPVQPRKALNARYEFISGPARHSSEYRHIQKPSPPGDHSSPLFVRVPFRQSYSSPSVMLVGCAET